MEDIDAELLSAKCYTEYGEYILNGRFAPNIFDGLKDVKRRLVETVSEMTVGLSKSADIVGKGFFHLCYAK